MRTAASSAGSNQTKEYDSQKAFEACMVLYALQGLLCGYGEDVHMIKREMNGLGTLTRWIFDAVYQDGLIRSSEFTDTTPVP